MNNQEIKYIVYSGLIAFIYFMWILPWAINTFDGQSPVTQFLLFNVGLYLIFFVFLKSSITDASTNMGVTAGLLSMFLALDCWMPEYHVAVSGALIPGASVGVGSTDYVFGVLANSLGLSGMFVYLFTYIAMPILLLFIAAKLIPNFVRKL